MLPEILVVFKIKAHRLGLIPNQLQTNKHNKISPSVCQSGQAVWAMWGNIPNSCTLSARSPKVNMDRVFIYCLTTVRTKISPIYSPLFKKLLINLICCQSTLFYACFLFFLVRQRYGGNNFIQA